MDQTLTEALILFVVFLINWGGHWVDWSIIPFLVDKTGKLHRVLAYIHGCTSILMGFAAWAFLHDAWDAAVFLVAAMVAAAVGTVLPRLWKLSWEIRKLREDTDHYEQTIEGGV
jgi:Na+/melibiose symporter-like transporter